MIRIGSVELGAMPRVVLALRDGVPREDAERALAEGVDLLEFRIDAFDEQDAKQVVQELSRFEGLPLIGTIRSAFEGGEWQGTEPERLALFQEIMGHVSAVDIELSAREIRPEVIQAARAAGKTVIGSYHNFEETPPLSALETIAAEATAHGVGIVKVACFCPGLEELQRLARFTLDRGQRNVVVIGMGKEALLSRIFFPALGSLLTYTFLGAPTAPGQLGCTQTLEYLNLYYPARR